MMCDTEIWLYCIWKIMGRDRKKRKAVEERPI